MRFSKVLGSFLLALVLVAALEAQTTCQVPGAPTILFVPPGGVGIGQTYVVVWSDAANLDDAGYYEVERSTSSSFTSTLDSQRLFSTSASFLATSQPTTLYH